MTTVILPADKRQPADQYFTPPAVADRLVRALVELLPPGVLEGA